MSNILYKSNLFTLSYLISINDFVQTGHMRPIDSYGIVMYITTRKKLFKMKFIADMLLQYFPEHTYVPNVFCFSSALETEKFITGTCVIYVNSNSFKCKPHLQIVLSNSFLLKCGRRPLSHKFTIIIYCMGNNAHTF